MAILWSINWMLLYGYGKGNMIKRIPNFNYKDIMGYHSQIDSPQQERSDRSLQTQTAYSSPADNTFIEIHDNGLMMKLFKRNHPRLAHWLESKIGQVYLQRQFAQQQEGKSNGK